MNFDPDTTVILDLVAAHPATEPVFRRYDAAAGCCILCSALFETVSAACARFGLDGQALAHDLAEAITTERP